MGFSTTRKIDLNSVWRRGTARSRCVLLALCVLAWAPIAFAQSDLVVDPRLLEFTPSPDHATVLRYELEVLPDTGTSVPVTVLNLGKPAPGADGQIRVDLTPWHLDTTLAPGTYRARVTATSSGGTAPSTASNPFTFSVDAPCTYTLSATSASYPATASSGTVSVTAVGTGCAWTSSSSLSWATVAGSGTGNGTATLMVAANTGAARTGTVTIAGQTFTVTQAAATTTTTPTPTPTTSTCRVDLSAGSEQIPAAGVSNWSVQLTTTTDCAWTAVSTVSWVTVLTPSGTGSGPIRYNVAANPTSATRSGGITVGPWTFVLNQAAGTGTAPAPTTCTYALGASSQSVAAAGGANSVAVTAGSGCAWTATSPVSWITIGTPSGSGNGTVNYTVAANTATTSRTATLTIAGRSFTVTQAAAATTTPPPAPTTCRYDLSAGSEQIKAGGANNWWVKITTTTGCPWTAVSSVPWITVITPSGTGTDQVRYSVAANTGAARSATIAIGGWNFTIYQAGR